MNGILMLIAIVKSQIEDQPKEIKQVIHYESKPRVKRKYKK